MLTEEEDTVSGQLKPLARVVCVCVLAERRLRLSCALTDSMLEEQG